MAHTSTYQAPKLGNILLAEDDEVVGQGLKKLLEHSNLNVKWAPTFPEALRILKNDDIHALIADVFISPPKPDGLDLIQLATEMGISSLIITAASDFEIAKEGLNRGADFLIEKPVQIELLMNRLMYIWENPRGLIARRERYLDLHSLTGKEKELCRLMLKGLSNQEIADLNGTTLGTVKFYSSQIFEKFQVKNRAELFNVIFPT